MTGEKILIVDDERIVRETFKAAFDEEYRILTAANGEEALEIINKPHDINLIVLDVIMPGITGLELLKKIKEIDPQMKVIILTGCDSKDVVIEALRRHADEYIDKPFDIDETRAMFEKLLHRSPPDGYESSEGIDAKIARARHFIEINCHKPLKLDDVASEIFLSPKYFSRIFREKTGKTFNQYRIESKINKAKDLMERHHLTVNQIAYQVGYESPESFTKVFKKCTGVSPADYRTQSRKRKRH
ncbi:MAG: response regulator [Candidatus Omnitrophica bacterium]|nr:response regulator [Candidatus Omnitrophota bacterium]